MRSQKENRVHFLACIFMLALSILGCQPVIAIGWNEFLIVVVLMAILLGPLIYRFMRRVEEILKGRRSDK